VKRSISIIILSALLLASVFSLAPTQAQDNIQSWPFIYYYSYKTGSWIIERADGSDGFAFGAGLNCGTIDSADWSPSGRWLLWHCNQREYYWTNRWIAVSADNSRRVTALDPFNDLFDDYVSARWSPTSDLILVNTIYRPSAPEQKPEWGPGVYVIDANRDEIVLQVTFDSLIDRAEWSPDGRYVLAYSLEPYDEETDQITVIPVNGEPSFIHENVSRQAANTYTMPHLIWTPDSRLITQPPNTALLVLEDLSTGARQELPFTTTPINYVEYSPDQQHGLIYAGSELWLYAVSTGTLTQIADDVILLPRHIISPVSNCPAGRRMAAAPYSLPRMGGCIGCTPTGTSPHLTCLPLRNPLPRRRACSGAATWLLSCGTISFTSTISPPKASFQRSPNRTPRLPIVTNHPCRMCRYRPMGAIWRIG
jgi:hypothetical protein